MTEAAFLQGFLIQDLSFRFGNYNDDMTFYETGCKCKSFGRALAGYVGSLES